MGNHNPVLEKALARSLKHVGGKPTLRQLEGSYIAHMLNAYGGNITRTAAALGLDRRTLQRKLARAASTAA
jgi:ActR/RegA family two-component response regulator